MKKAPNHHKGPNSHPSPKLGRTRIIKNKSGFSILYDSWLVNCCLQYPRNNTGLLIAVLIVFPSSSVVFHVIAYFFRLLHLIRFDFFLLVWFRVFAKISVKTSQISTDPCMAKAQGILSKYRELYPMLLRMCCFFFPSRRQC